MRLTIIASAFCAIAAIATPVHTVHADGEIKCTMKFKLKGWSAFYKTSTGKGTITCSNGQTFAVTLDAKGGGLSFGKSTIDNGVGEFSAVTSTDELFGSYIAGEAHAGAVKSSKATVMTKGEVSLALTGTGRGFDLGVAFGKLTVARQ